VPPRYSKESFERESPHQRLRPVTEINVRSSLFPRGGVCTLVIRHVSVSIARCAVPSTREDNTEISHKILLDDRIYMSTHVGALKCLRTIISSVLSRTIHARITSSDLDSIRILLDIDRRRNFYYPWFLYKENKNSPHRRYLP